MSICYNLDMLQRAYAALQTFTRGSVPTVSPRSTNGSKASSTQVSRNQGAESQATPVVQTTSESRRATAASMLDAKRPA